MYIQNSKYKTMANSHYLLLVQQTRHSTPEWNRMEWNGIFVKWYYILDQINNDNYEFCCRWCSCREIIWHSRIAHTFEIISAQTIPMQWNESFLNQNKDKWTRWARIKEINKFLFVCEIDGKWKAACSCAHCCTKIQLTENGMV